jgi:D-alanyl-D-alanine carboxypeptidase
VARVRSVVGWVTAVAVASLAVSAAAIAAEPPRSVSGQASAIDDATWQRMQGRTWRAGLGCPPRERLALLTVPHIDFDGAAQVGRMVVAADTARDVLSVFADLHAKRFPIASMRLVDEFEGDDDASMAANNTSAFNCRLAFGKDRLSEHSFGTAIDINPRQNPFVIDGRVMPAEGRAYATPAVRRKPQPGLITADDPVVRAFVRIGWGWGGEWTGKRDYQHFSRSGR